MIASYSSNVAILVHDLMLARGIARQTSVHAIDVQGRVYCGCGASFCMEMERRAKKEPSRGTKSMVEVFKGSFIDNLKLQPLRPATARTVPAKKIQRRACTTGSSSAACSQNVLIRSTYARAHES